MKQIVLLLALIHFTQASTLNLKNVLASADNNTLTQAIDQERLFLEAKNMADTSLDPIEIYGTSTKAYPKNGVQDDEYSMGLSKKFSLGNTQNEDQMITRLNNEAYLLEEDKKILNFKNGLKNLYHQHCLDAKNYKSFHQIYRDFEKLYEKKQKAYQYQEISKTELMQLEIEKNRLFTQLHEIKMTQKMSKQKVFILSQIKQSEESLFSCTDMYPVDANFKFEENKFQLSKKAHDKRIHSTQVAVERYSKVLDSVSLAVQYDKEIDIDKYTIGVSIPLTFSSQRSEQERVAALHKNSALSFHHEQMMLEKQSVFAELKSTLDSQSLMIKSLKKNLDDYKKSLLPLIQKSYDLGESSVIEYLLNTQNYHRMKQELFATQKAYYSTLFRLYTLIEMKDHS